MSRGQQWRAVGRVCVRSPNSAQFFCSILASYVRCFLLGDVLGLCGSVPGLAAMCASFLAVELPFSS